MESLTDNDHLKGCLPTRPRLMAKGVQCPGSWSLCEHSMENEWQIYRTW